MLNLQLQQCLCAFAGSHSGKESIYREDAYALGLAIAKKRITLVYGGSNKGLMGAIADAVLAEGGEVIGVAPRRTAPNMAIHERLTHLMEIETLQERKAIMKQLAHAFVVLPGGLGTFDELFEVMVESYLRLHTKPIGLLNTADYFSPVIRLLEHMTDEEFTSPHRAVHLHFHTNPFELVEQLFP